MKASELARLAAECEPDMEIFIKDKDGYLHDFKAEPRDAVFDGFDTVYEGGMNFVVTD